jgi:hypothetical protein
MELDVDIAWLGYDIPDDDVCAAVELVRCLDENDSVRCLCGGEDRGPGLDVCCLDESELLFSECPLEFR